MYRAKTQEKIDAMRAAGIAHRKIAAVMRGNALPGTPTKTLEWIATQMANELSVKLSCKGYRGFPSHVCLSVNDAVVHGLPSDRELKDGDLLKIDFTVEHNGYHVDAAQTVLVGRVSKDAERLVQATQNALKAAIRKVRPGGTLTDLACEVQFEAAYHSLGNVTDYQGHFIGEKIHEKPGVPNDAMFITKDVVLKPGMTFCIEPMFTLGSPETKVDKDGWTVLTVDGSLAAHFEHTILVTEKGHEVLT